MSVRLADMRAESSFRAGIAPAGNDKLKITMLIIKNQMIYPFVQGFLWAVFKDWMALGKLYASTNGSQVGRELRSRFSQWLRGWLGFYGSASVEPEVSPSIN